MSGVPRAQRYQQIMELRKQGLSHRKIGETLGLSRATVANIISDPDGEKQRKRREGYRGQCVDCGYPTDGSNGPAKASLRCKYCATGRPRPHAAIPRLRIPIRLSEVPEEVRLDAVVEAGRRESDEDARVELLLAAIHPSDETYWVSERAKRIIESWAA